MEQCDSVTLSKKHSTHARMYGMWHACTYAHKCTYCTRTRARTHTHTNTHNTHTLTHAGAAPLTADARQRIVSEFLDLKNFVSISMTVGPASGVLKDADPSVWKPFEVALTVLVDRYRGTHGWVLVVCRVVRLRVRSWVGWWAF